MIKYFDYNASTPIDKEVLEVMIGAYKAQFGNADSRTHLHGNNAREVIETAREQIAALVGGDKNEIVFTSGATESSNTLILGLKDWGLKSGKTHIVTTSIEHKATLEPVKYLERHGFTVDYISPDKSGRVDEKKVIAKVTDKTLLVTIHHVNNETGIIQPVEEISRHTKKKGVYLHVDAAQSLGKLVHPLRMIDFDFLSVSAHKMYGPQGIGALVLRKKNYKKPPVAPLLLGGGQEWGMRAGTLPVALIVGFGKACELALHNYEKWNDHYRKVKMLILKKLKDSELKIEINGEQYFCVDNTLNISFLGVNSEALMIAAKEYCSLANGSACTSKDYSHSYVLKAMGLSDDITQSAVRLSWGKDSTPDGIDKIIEIARAMV